MLNTTPGPPSPPLVIPIKSPNVPKESGTALGWKTGYEYVLNRGRLDRGYLNDIREAPFQYQIAPFADRPLFVSVEIFGRHHGRISKTDHERSGRRRKLKWEKGEVNRPMAVRRAPNHDHLENYWPRPQFDASDLM